MKVIVNGNENKTKVEYPCLMIQIGGNSIILFTEECVGTVIKHDCYPVGEHATDWLSEQHWIPFVGKIEISN